MTCCAVSGSHCFFSPVHQSNRRTIGMKSRIISALRSFEENFSSCSLRFDLNSLMLFSIRRLQRLLIPVLLWSWRSWWWLGFWNIVCGVFGSLWCTFISGKRPKIWAKVTSFPTGAMVTRARYLERFGFNMQSTGIMTGYGYEFGLTGGEHGTIIKPINQWTN